ncbi:MAG: hypothetical protein DRJ65_02665 [Acidobacteria bacterium]|nr:MAG: hypothetical protein DRJ65_02665 [Acidobacteriota bacterium]
MFASVPQSEQRGPLNSVSVHPLGNCNTGIVAQMIGKSSSPTAKERGNWTRICLWMSAVIYFAGVVILNALQIKALAFTKGVDQTYLFESLANTVHGHFFVHTHAITNLGGWGLMDHFWPSMLLLVPFVAVFENILSLYIINALCLTATGLVFARLARRFFENETIGFLSALVFWTMPESFAFAFTGNWPEVWAMPFFAMLFLFYFEDRPLAFSLSAVAFMGCMEHLLVYVIIFAAIEVIGRRRWHWMVLPLALAVSYGGIIMLASSGASSGRFFTHTFALTGPRIFGFLTMLFFEWGRSPLLYLSLLWPRALIFAMPPALIVTAWRLDIGLLPINDGTLRYAFFIFIPMVVGGLRGLRPLAEAVARRLNLSTARTAILFLSFALLVHAATLTTMWPNEKHRFRQTPSDRLTWEIIESLPSTARVATNREIPFAFFGRVDTFAGFFNMPFFNLQEFYFDRRNQPIPPWSGVEKFQALGRHTPAVLVLENADGNFRPVTALWATKNFPYQYVRCTDATDDGRPDILLGSPDGRTLVFAADTTQPMAFGDPVTLDQVESLENFGHSPHLPQLKANGDLGHEFQIAPDHQRLLFSFKDPEKVPNQEILVDGFLEEIAAADLDGDGTKELLVVDSQRYLIRVFGRGIDGTWAERQAIPAPPIPTSIAVTDLDADGDQDLVVTKSQRPPGVEAFARLIDHEKINHIFWFNNPLQDDLRRYFSHLRWSIEEAGDLLYLSRPSDAPRQK